MYMYFVFVVGTGTGMSPHVAMRCVWWCITSRLLLLAWGGSTCSSGTMTIVKLRTTSSANTLQVLLPQYFNILLLWKDLNTVDPDSFSPQSCHWTLPPLPTPLKQVKHTRFLLLKEMLPHMIHQTLWKVIVVSIQSEHYGCFSLQMSSLHLCCRGIQVTTTRTEVQVNRPNIPPTPQFWCCQTQMPTWKSLNLYLSVVHISFSALNLVYIIIPTIPLILLLLTVTGVCCFKLLARRWGSKPKANNKHKQKFYFTWIFPVITFQTALRALIWSLLSRLCYDRVMCSKPKAAYCISFCSFTKIIIVLKTYCTVS